MGERKAGCACNWSNSLQAGCEPGSLLREMPLYSHRADGRRGCYTEASGEFQIYKDSLLLLTERNSQYSQQQTQYQQGSGTHQTFSQQQYPSQTGYSAQPQGYGAGQGSSSQYPQYQQGQGQQYPSYRSIQPGPAAPSQRPYSFEQGQYGNYQQ